MFWPVYLRWADVDPATHPFDPATVADVPEGGRVMDAYVRDYGLWTVGLAWWTMHGGPTRGDTKREALLDWRRFLEEVAAVFAALPAPRSLEAGLAAAAPPLLDIVLARNVEAEGDWYDVLATALQWYVEHAKLSPDNLRAQLSQAAAYHFAAYRESSAAEAARGCQAMVKWVTRERVPFVDDAIVAWRQIRDRAWFVMGDMIRSYANDRPVVPDRDDPRLQEALLLCRDSARRQMPLSFDQLAEWHAIVQRASTPTPLRNIELRDRRACHPLRLDLAALVDAALADASTPSRTFTPLVRAARVMIDLRVLAPFAVDNDAACRLALDHVLTSHGLAMQDAAPIVAFAQIADDATAAKSLAGLLEILTGPTSR